MCGYRGESTHFHLDELRYIRLRAVRIALAIITLIF
jgi:hypothetical protein